MATNNIDVRLKDGRTIYIHRGLCGIPLKLQCLYIGSTYTIVAVFSIGIASMMLHSPIKYIDLDTLAVDSTKHNISYGMNGTVEEPPVPTVEPESTMDEIDRLTAMALHEIGSNGIELLVEGLSSFVASALLVHGVRQEKTSFIFPWVIITILLTIANFVTFMVKVASPSSISVGKVFAAVIYFAIASYFILSVYSYYQILKIRKRKVTTFLDHEFQGGEGSWYHTLEEEGMEDASLPPAYPVPAYSDALPAYRAHPFSRPHPPYTEKAVPMTDEEDFGKENVLFAKI